MEQEIQIADMPIPYPETFPFMVASVLSGMLANPNAGAVNDHMVSRAIKAAVLVQNAAFDRLNAGVKRGG